MQMRLLGDLHRASLGGARVEQVGQTTGNSPQVPLGGSFYPVPGFPRPASSQEVLPECSGLCSMRYLGSC